MDAGARDLGSGDFITAEDDHQRIVDLVNMNHPGPASLKTIDGMDHHFDAAGTQRQAYGLRVKRLRTLPYDEQLSAAVGEWLCQRERRS